MTDRPVTRINAAPDVVTFINVYDVTPEKQQELVNRLAAATEKVFRHQPGFVSVNIHRSLDGTRVVNYTQWASKAELERLQQNPDAQARFREFAAIATRVSPGLYEVSSVHAG